MPFISQSQFIYEGRDLEAMSFAPKYHRLIVGMFKPFLGKHVAEVGAGSGNLTTLLAEEPLDELVAIEPSPEMFSLLENACGHDSRVVTENAFFADVHDHYLEHFDSIVYVNVLEHVEDHARELALMRASLKPGGYALIFVPALQWLYGAHDEAVGHHRRYHKRELYDMVEQAGFHIVKIRYFDMLGVIPWFIMARLMKRSLAPGSAAFYDRFVVPILAVLESWIKPPIGKNLIVIARKK